MPASTPAGRIFQTGHPADRSDDKDFNAVDAKGDISFSHEQWQGLQSKKKMIFKSVRPVSGNEFIRIFNGNMAVVIFLINMQFEMDGREVNRKIIRLAIFHKTSGAWWLMASQGTKVDEKLFLVIIKN